MTWLSGLLEEENFVYLLKGKEEGNLFMIKYPVHQSDDWGENPGSEEYQCGTLAPYAQSTNFDSSLVNNPKHV